ncbi:MAG: pro-sigmaK processing inhibitor BofA family protein [Clostridium sp.]|jgi:inhibitor of the pro-sigma K processing machinery|nr:pro-sigmaK processing inhibitor BofA family protein [Clostridium sp.]
MEKYIGIIFIVAACAVALLIGALRRKSEWLLNLLLRGIVGTIAIYFVNLGLEKAGIYIHIGLNAATVLTAAFLGFPGVAALYGIGFYQML